MEDITETLARNFHLTSEEEDGVVIETRSTAARATTYSHILVGRVVTAREISAHTIKSNLLRLLQPVKGCIVDPLPQNRFVLQFEHRVDYNHALSGCPWLLEKNAVILQEVDPDSDPTNVTLNLLHIIVRIHNVPMRQRCDEVAKLIGDKIGRFVEKVAQRTSDQQLWMRVKVQIDVLQKLKRGMYLHEANGNKVWVTFTYERLPNFCFLCGILGHGEGKCPLRYEEGFIDPGENLPYGTWLRASTDLSRDTPRLPLQATNHSKPSLAPRGSEIFSFTSPVRNRNGQDERAQDKENTTMPLVDDRNLITNPVHMHQMENMGAASRKFITVPRKNRKKKANDIMEHDALRQGKKPHLHLRDEELSSTAETATQSRRSS